MYCRGHWTKGAAGILLMVYICESQFISAYESWLMSTPRASTVITLDLNHLGVMRRAKTHNLLMRRSVMMAIEWSGHMCGSALYEFLMVTEPGGGGFIRENRWAGKEGGSHQAEKRPAGRLLMVEWITDVCWSSGVRMQCIICSQPFFLSTGMH